MAIRIKITADLTAFDGLEALIGNAQRAATEIMDGVEKKHGTRLVRPLRTLRPGRSRHGAKKGAWSTNPVSDAKARRWWYANHGPGPYRRTGKTNRAWFLQQKGGKLVLENLAAKSNGQFVGKYIFSLSGRARGGRPNPGHIRTGWPQKSRKAAFKVIEEAIDIVELSYAKSLAASVAAGKFKIVVG